MALISFTNAAVEEAVGRFAGGPELAESPNFVGTIDRFISRFIVSLIYLERHQRAISVRDSWAGHQGAQFSVKGVASPRQFSLTWFRLEPTGNVYLEPERAEASYHDQLKSLGTDAKSRVVREARRRLIQFEKSGIVSADYVRALFQDYIREEPTRVILKRLLSRRFYEVILDEAQDCSTCDSELLKLLLDAGVSVVLVGDPDQGIYQFRGAAPNTLSEIVARIPRGPRMNENYRSSPAIVDLVNCLRGSSQERDVASGRNSVVPHPVEVIEVDKMRSAPANIRSILDRYKIEHSSLVCLAHKTAVARQIAGAPGEARFSSSKLISIANTCSSLNDSTNSDPRGRLAALKQLEGTIVDLAKSESTAFLTDDQFAVETGCTRDEFRAGCLRLVGGLRAREMLPSEFKAVILDRFRRLDWARWLNFSKLRIPDGDKWQGLTKKNSDSLAWSTVHGYKGLQARATAIAIPESDPRWSIRADAIWQWETRTEGEARRVLYVAASRAEELAILVVHRTRIDSVVRCLEAGAVYYEIS